MNTENLIETNDSGILWQTFSLPSSCPGENVFCRLAQPQTPFRGIVQISHGMCEYIDRYLPFFRFLAKEGFVVCGNDHLGHGKSCPDASRLGFFSSQNGYHQLVEDLHSVSLYLKKRYPDLPLFLFGHSMGSMIARLYLSKHADLLAGVVLCGTAGPNPASRAGMAICRKVIASKGEMYHSQKLYDLLFGSFNKRFSNLYSGPAVRFSLYCGGISGFNFPAILLQHEALVQDPAAKSADAADFRQHGPGGRVWKRNLCHCQKFAQRRHPGPDCLALPRSTA